MHYLLWYSDLSYGQTVDFYGKLCPRSEVTREAFARSKGKSRLGYPNVTRRTRETGQRNTGYRIYRWTTHRSHIG